MRKKRSKIEGELVVKYAVLFGFFVAHFVAFACHRMFQWIPF